MYLFGSGLLWAAPTLDASGAAIANPTPLLLGTLQESEVDIKFDLKKLYGQKSFPAAVARGQGSIAGKAKFATIFGAFLETILFGQTGSAGLISAVADTTGAVIPATPFQVTVTPPNSGTFDQDLGVISAQTGLPLTRVASAPATGQYTVSEGVYTFASADVGKTVYINYRYTATSTTARKGTVKNLNMGLAPEFRFDMYTSYQGKSTIFSFGKCISNGLKFSNKNDDFTVPDFGFEVFEDAAGNVMSWGTSE